MHQLNLTMSSICQFFLFMLLINANNIFPRSGDRIDLTISDTGLNLKNFHIKWTPKNKVFDVESDKASTINSNHFPPSSHYTTEAGSAKEGI